MDLYIFGLALHFALGIVCLESVSTLIVEVQKISSEFSE